MVKITLRVSYHADETADSFLSRLAAANCVRSVSEFSRLVKLDHTKIAKGDADAVARLFDLAGYDTAAVASSRRASSSPHREFGFGAIPSNRLSTATFRFCPLCLQADRQSGMDKPSLAPYRRISWLLTSFRTCPTHGLPLLAIKGESARPIDFLGSVRPFAEAFPEMTAGLVSRACAFEAYLEKRVNTGTGGYELPDALGMQGLIKVAEAIGQVVEFGPTVRHNGLDEAALARSANAGFELLRGGERALDQFLRDLEPKQEGPRKASIYSTWGRFFGVINEHRGTDIEPVKAILRRAILRRYPKKMGSIVLGERVTSRSVHTFESVAKASGMVPKTLRRLIDNAPQLRSSGASAHRASSITTENLDRIIETVSRCVTGKELRVSLGITEKQLSRFSQYGIVSKMPGLERYFDRFSAESLLAKLSAAATPTLSPPLNCWSMVDAISSGLSIRKVITFIEESRLDQIWYVEAEVGLKRIWLDRQESRKKLHNTSRH